MPNHAAASDTTPEKCAWTVMEWCRATTLSRPTVYGLINGGQIESVLFGAKRLILTPPLAYLRSLQGAA